MLGEILFRKSSLPAVLKSLDAGMLRARAISDNIANVNTPGYRRVEVSFEQELSHALSRSRLKGARTSEKHIALGRKNIDDVHPAVSRPADPTLPSGVNNVDIDKEMAKLAENQILYQYGVRFAKGKYTKMNAAIQGKPVQ